MMRVNKRMKKKIKNRNEYGPVSVMVFGTFLVYSWFFFLVEVYIWVSEYIWEYI